MTKAMFAAIAALFLVGVSSVRAAEPWETFTPPPPLPAFDVEGRVAHEGARIWFATFGSGSPVILLHGAGGASDDLAGQVAPLVADHHRVIVIDSRGQGRSTMGARPLGYELMESDVVAVMDALNVRKAAVVGWSDGAILSLIMAMKHPDRVSRVFAFSPNMDLHGLAPDWMSKPIVAQAMASAQANYTRLSPTPNDFEAAFTAVAKMTETEPNYSARQLAAIHGPAIAIVEGDHEELIAPEHTRYLARTIPHARLIMLKRVGHAAPLQDSAQFNQAMLAFLDAR